MNVSPRRCASDECTYRGVEIGAAKPEVLWRCSPDGTTLDFPVPRSFAMANTDTYVRARIDAATSGCTPGVSDAASTPVID